MPSPTPVTLVATLADLTPESLPAARTHALQVADLVEFRLDRLPTLPLRDLLGEAAARAIVTVRPVREGGAFDGRRGRRVRRGSAKRWPLAPPSSTSNGTRRLPTRSLPRTRARGPVAARLHRHAGEPAGRGARDGTPTAGGRQGGRDAGAAHRPGHPPPGRRAGGRDAGGADCHGDGGPAVAPPASQRRLLLDVWRRRGRARPGAARGDAEPLSRRAADRRHAGVRRGRTADRPLVVADAAQRRPAGARHRRRLRAVRGPRHRRPPRRPPRPWACGA